MNSINPALPLSRRSVIAGLAVAGGGAVFGVPLALAQQTKPDFGPGGPDEAFKLWLKVDANSIVTVGMHLSEMGQGISTSLPQLVADELGVDWDNMRFAFTPNGAVYYNRGFGSKTESTGGSTSIRGQFIMFREIGATAREMFKSAAAAKWNVPAADLTVAHGRIVHAKSGRSLTLGEMAAAAAKQTPPKSVTLKPKSEWTLIGTSVPRLDTPAKVDGSAGYGADVKVPGMVVATIQRCPVFTGRLTSVDDAPALKVPGVQAVVKLDDAVAVVADGYWTAQKGLKALTPVWDTGARATYGLADLNADLDAGLRRTDAPVLLAKGDVDGTLKTAVTTATFEYQAPYLTHACMEPMNATVHVQADRVDVWTPGQGNTTVVEGISKALNIDPLSIHVTRTYLGGGFGRRGEADVAVQAALISKAVGRPVKLMWSREEDIRQDFYRPAAKVRFTAGLDANGVLVAWDIANACPSISKRRFPAQVKDGKDPSNLAGFGDQPYNIDHMRVRYAMVENGIPVGYWRAVNHTQNIFFRESMINELALRAKMDGLAYRRLMLAGNARYLALLDAVAKLSDYDQPLKPGPVGTKRGRGVAIGNSQGSMCAQVVDVTVASDNTFTVDRFSCVIDVGVIVHPSIVEAQMESSIIDGLGMTMFGGVTPKDGGMTEGNFSDVRFMRINECPEIRVQVKDWPDVGPGGVGEPGVPPTAPALTDAILRATGQHIRALPVVKQGYSV